MKTLLFLIAFAIIYMLYFVPKQAVVQLNVLPSDYNSSTDMLQTASGTWSLQASNYSAIQGSGTESIQE